MTLKHLTIGKRIGLLSGCLLILLVAAGTISVTGIGNIVHNSELVISGNRLDGVLAQREVDHLNWANRKHHQDHRRDCISDQFAGPERGG
ncbi:MAG: hypothetical protein WCR46_16805 [Deltaproteobacteria bacterium]